MASDLDRSITFSEFVRYTCTLRDMQMDEHWRSQAWFVQADLSQYEWVGRFEAPEEFLLRLESHFGIRILCEIPMAMVADYSAVDTEGVADQLLAETVDARRARPAPAAFYTPELRALVQERFALDFELYRRAFGVDAEL